MLETQGCSDVRQSPRVIVERAEHSSYGSTPEAGLPGLRPGSATQWLCVLGNHLTGPPSAN